MVGLSDIPCVGVALNKISEATVEAAIRGLRYMLCYKGLLKDLNSEIDKVEIQEGRVARLIVEARDDGKIIEAHVVAWQGDVQNVKTRADELTRSQTTSITCFNVVRFPNPVSRFRLGRKAAHLATTVTQHTAYGEKFLPNEIAHYAPYENLPISDTSYQIFASRQEAYGKLWTALVNNDGSPIIGIYGMPGAGKTRMMEQTWTELKDKKIFDKVARANVGGEQLDVIKLQDQLSGYLNCHLESKDNEVQRASQLKRSLMAEGQKILVILDDVWADIPLNKIGIPFGDGSSKGCKILLTSRDRNVCLRNNCTDPIQITTLRNDEAWKMFSNTVGTSNIDSLEDRSLAEKVCDECGGLPLLIDAVGRSLKVLTKKSWKDALNQLENSKFQEITDGINPKVYTGLKFSFEKLGEGEKVCLLLCSFFPEDAEIDIKMLFDMATGSQLLDSGRDIGGLVDILKSSSLLLEGRDVESVKVHDIIRDVARSIATRDPDYAFLSLRCRSQLRNNDQEYRTRRLLRLDLEGENVEFPDDLCCPELHTLWLQSYSHSQQLLSSVFFNAFVNLKVLLLQGQFLFDQQLIIHNLGKLRVLILNNCNISQTFLSSVSRNLETLCIQECDLPSPLDLPELKNLRKLELVGMGEIEIVEEGISRISRVEELIVPNGFKSRDDDDDAYIYRELSQLGCLRNLEIWLKKLPDRDIFSSLVDFNILAGDRWNYFHMDVKWKKYVFCRRIYVERWVMPLLERAEELELNDVTGLPINGFSDSNMEIAFAKLKYMTLWNCDEMEHVASWEGRNQRLTCFTNLTSLVIDDCYGLKYVFSDSVAKCLLQLQRLCVERCDEIEEIIRVEDSTDHDGQEIICFPNLQTLYLTNLASLTCFCKKKVTFPNITDVQINSIDLLEEIGLGSDDYSSSKLRKLTISCETKQLLPSQLKLHLQYLEKLKLENCCWPGQDSLFDGSLTFNTLKKLYVYNCPVSTLFTRSVFTNLQHLEWLEVSDCSLLKEIVEEEDARDDGTNENKTPISLLQLKYVILSKLPNLQNIGISACYMPALVSVYVTECGMITSLFTRSAFTNLQHLGILKVSDCSLLKEIVEEEDARDDGTIENKTPISLLHFEYVTLSKLPNLQNIGISACYMPALVKVEVTECGMITSLFTPSAFTNLQHLEKLDVRDCSLLKEIVEEEDARDDGTIENKTPISLLQLRSITLSKLPNLQNIGISGWYMPALVKVEVTECGMITSLFTRSAFTNLQCLEILKVSDCSLLKEIVEEEDARDDGTNENKTPISLQLKYVTLSKLPNLQNIGISACYMPALVNVYVYSCDLITSLFTHSAFTNLQHLRELKVSDCSLLKEIVEEEDARDDGTNENKTPISLLHLLYLTLSKLPNLQNIGISGWYMPALVKVEVTECGMITSLFTRSAFTNLQCLRELKVHGAICWK